jgi:hypothetical protein
MVTVVKPEGIGDLIDEEGTLMEHGKFSFDLTEEIAIDTELEVEITGVRAVDRHLLRHKNAPEKQQAPEEFHQKPTRACLAYMK